MNKKLEKSGVISFFDAAKRLFSREVKEEKEAWHVEVFAVPVLTALFSFASSGASPALGALPFGTAILSAAPTVSTVLSALVGALAASFRLGARAMPFVLVSVGTVVLRFALGALGRVRTKTVDSRYLGQSGRTKKLSDAVGVLKAASAFNSPIYVRVVVSLAAALTLGILNVISGGSLWYDVFGAALAVAVSPLLCYALASFAEPSANPVMRRAGGGALIYILIFSISGVAIGGIKLAVVAAFVISLSAGRVFGVADGAMIGTFAALGAPGGLFAVFPVAAMCSGAVGVYSLGVSCVVSTVIGMSLALASTGVAAISGVLPEVVLGAALFYPAARFDLLPQGNYSIPDERRTAPVKDGAALERMKNLSVAMERISRVIGRLSENLRTPDKTALLQLCERAFYTYCDSCPKRDICHTRESFEAGGATRRVADALGNSGRVDISSMPETMARGCPSADHIIADVNSYYRALVEEAVKGDRTASAAEDFKGISRLILDCTEDAERESSRNEKLSDALEERLSSEGIVFESLGVYGTRRPRVYIRGFTAKDLTCGAEDLRKMTEEVCKTSFCDPEMSIEYDKLNLYTECRRRFAAKYGLYSAEGSSLEANGDTVRAFHGLDGEFFLLICDGMGSGRDAALTSHVSAIFLERLLSTGCTVASSLRMLNDFNRARKIECFSTVDLLKIDTFSGDAVFYKSGGAPSYIVREGRVFRIECDSTPLGIIDSPTLRTVNFKLRRGDAVVMLSDGASPDDDDAAWLFDRLTDTKRFAGSLPTLAKDIAAEAVKHAEHPDDTTVGIIRIDNAA